MRAMRPLFAPSPYDLGLDAVQRVWPVVVQDAEQPAVRYLQRRAVE